MHSPPELPTASPGKRPFRDGNPQLTTWRSIMKKTRKLLAGMLAAAGIAGAVAIAYADPPGGFGPGMMSGYGPGEGGGYGPGYGMGPGMMGPGMMGPGMMGGGMMGGDWGPRGGFGPGTAAGPVAHEEARLAFLKSEFKIAGAQEPAWEAYAKQAKAQARTMETFRTQPAAIAQSAPERLKQRAEFAKQRAEQLTAGSAALQDLYAVLTPEQKAIADRYFGGMHVTQ